MFVWFVCIVIKIRRSKISGKRRHLILPRTKNYRWWTHKYEKYTQILISYSCYLLHQYLWNFSFLLFIYIRLPRLEKTPYIFWFLFVWPITWRVQIDWHTYCLIKSFKKCRVIHEKPTPFILKTRNNALYLLKRGWY